MQHFLSRRNDVAAIFLSPPASFMDTPTGMQVAERRLEQAAEDVRSRPAQAGSGC